MLSNNSNITPKLRTGEIDLPTNPALMRPLCMSGPSGRLDIYPGYTKRIGTDLSGKVIQKSIKDR